MTGKKVSESKTEQSHLVMYTDINGINRLFGGELLKWIDEVATITAKRHCGHNVATIAIDNLHFKSPAFLNDMIVLIGTVTYVRKTSMEVRVDTYLEKPDTTRHPINRAYLVMVSIDEEGQPLEVPPLIPETCSEQMEWVNAAKRRKLRMLRKKEGF